VGESGAASEVEMERGRGVVRGAKEGLAGGH